MNISQCRSCGADIVWLKTRNGKNIPVDAETVHDEGAEVFDFNTMTSHFSTCPNADKHRTRKIKCAACEEKDKIIAQLKDELASITNIENDDWQGKEQEEQDFFPFE